MYYFFIFTLLFQFWCLTPWANTELNPFQNAQVEKVGDSHYQVTIEPCKEYAAIKINGIELLNILMGKTPGDKKQAAAIIEKDIGSYSPPYLWD